MGKMEDTATGLLVQILSILVAVIPASFSFLVENFYAGFQASTTSPSGPFFVGLPLEPRVERFLRT